MLSRIVPTGSPSRPPPSSPFSQVRTWLVVGLVLLLAGGGGAPLQAHSATLVTAVVQAAPSDEVVVRTDVMVPMRDGTELATDVYLPAEDGEALQVVHHDANRPSHVELPVMLMEALQEKVVEPPRRKTPPSERPRGSAGRAVSIRLASRRSIGPRPSSRMSGLIVQNDRSGIFDVGSLL